VAPALLQHLSSPGLMIVPTMMSIQLIRDDLREVLDPPKTE
jgi:ABC-type dipeptide/oligopeptide/nickel transport system permease subunit